MFEADERTRLRVKFVPSTPPDIRVEVLLLIFAKETLMVHVRGHRIRIEVLAGKIHCMSLNEGCVYRDKVRVME